MNYRVGLDIGVASVGWCVFECDKNGEPLRIMDLGVRVFEGAENPKTGASLALPRREARGLRRRLRRRAHRLERVRFLLTQNFGQDVLDKAENNRDDIFRLRYIGLSRQLKSEELARILIYFAKHRGFQSNRKKKANKDEGKLLEAVKKNGEVMSLHNYRTVGEMIYRDGSFFDVVDGKRIYKTRNKEGDYSKTFDRQSLKNELELILSEQVKQRLITEDFKNKYLEIFSSQRSFDEGPAYPSPYRAEGYNVGFCTLLGRTEPRAPKASYTFEYFNALLRINNLKVNCCGEERFLTADEREKLYETARTKKELSFSDVKKLLSLPDEATFNLLSYSAKTDGKGKSAEQIEKDNKLFKMHKSYEIRAKLSGENKNDIALLDKVAEILSHYKTEERIKAKFDEFEAAPLSAAEREALLETDCSTFGNLSLKAMKILIPFLEQGLKYDKACSAAGIDFKAHGSGFEKLKKLRGGDINEEIKSIEVPVVRRSVSQTVKVLNAIIDRYGSPCAVNIELARELSKSFEERKKIESDNLKSGADYQRDLERLRNEYRLVNPKGADVLKLRLYEEQGGKCAYSLKLIDVTRLFESNYVQIDHIIPYSRSFDDSYGNKALVLTGENQNKGNRTPYEYLGDDAARWAEFEAFVTTQYSHGQGFKKRKNLLCRSFGRDSENDWRERNLNDTKYISRFVYNLINDYLYLQPIAGKKKQVVAVNGRITSYLRKFWGLAKVREDGDKHHALDAAVIACVSDGVIQKITKYNQIKERCGEWDRELGRYRFPDGDGVLLEEDEFDARNGYIAKPYVGFREELLLRLTEHPQEYVSPNLILLQSLGYSHEDIANVSPVFVSRMPNRKAHGPIHKETIRSARSLDKGVSASKVPLTSLKLTKDKSAIEGYDEKAKRDDRLLYEALYARLSAFDGDAKTAFSEPIYKPAKDGRQGNPVKKVWITEAFDTGMQLSGRSCVAENGGMVRVDVFEKNGRYYCVPVYIKDIYAKRLPDRAITPNKKYEDWDKIDGSFEFLFALFPNDLIYVEAKKPFNLKSPLKENGQIISTDKGFFYYKFMDISSDRITIITHDNGLKGRVNSKRLTKLKKYTVDVLGDKHLVEKEKRLNAEWDT